MPVYRLTNENFDKVLEENTIVLVDFWAQWCTTCTSFSSIYEAIADLNSDIRFAKVNTQIEQEISIRYRIQSIPTLIVFQDQKAIFRKPGAMASHMLESLISDIRNNKIID